MPSKERTKNEIQFLTEANLTPRNVTGFCHAGRQCLSGALLPATLLRASQRATRNKRLRRPTCLQVCEPSSTPLHPTRKLAENINMLFGPAEAWCPQRPDGKFVVDTFVAPAWPKLKEALAGLGNAP